MPNVDCPAPPAISGKTPDPESKNLTKPDLPAVGKQLLQRQLKQKQPQRVILPEKPNSTAEKLNRELKGLDAKGPEFARKLTQLWNESIAQLLTTPLPSAANADVAKGVMLPKEIMPVLESTESRSHDESAIAMLCGVSGMAAFGRSELLSQFANQRANVLPPTAADIAVFEALDEGIREVSSMPGAASFELWEPFANATNPIYRMLALRAATYTTSRAVAGFTSDELPNFTQVDTAAKLAFYLKYLNEKDSVILMEALDSLSAVPLPKAREAIEKFHASQLEKGDEVLAKAAADALRIQELITKGAH